MQVLLWMTAGVLVRVDAGTTPPDPPTPPDNKGGGDGVDRYRRRRRALALYLRKVESQRRLDEALGIKLTQEAAANRARKVDERLARIHGLAEDIEVNIKMARVAKAKAQAEYELAEAEYRQARAVQDELESHEVLDKFLAYTEEHAKAFHASALQERARRASQHHAEAQERAKEEQEEEQRMHEALLEASRKAERVREIELEIAVLKREEELAQALTSKAKSAGVKPKLEPDKAKALMERINSYMSKT